MKTPTFKTAEQLVRFSIETNTGIRENFQKLILKELKILKVFSVSKVIDSKRFFKTHALNFIALYAVCSSTTVFDNDFDLYEKMHFAFIFCEDNGISKDFELSENFRRVKKLLGL